MLPVTQNDERELKSSIFQDIIRKMCSTLKSHWIACTKIDFHPGWPQVWWFVPSLKNLTELIPAGFNYINVTEGRNSWFVNVSPACNFFCLRVFSVIFFCVVTSTELFREDGSAPRPAPTAITIEHPWFHLRSRTNVLSFVSRVRRAHMSSHPPGFSMSSPSMRSPGPHFGWQTLFAFRSALKTYLFHTARRVATKGDLLGLLLPPCPCNTSTLLPLHLYNQLYERCCRSVDSETIRDGREFIAPCMPQRSAASSRKLCVGWLFGDKEMDRVKHNFSVRSMRYLVFVILL